VHRFRNAGKINMQVYGEMCMNQECPKRQPNYTPREGEKVDRNCGSVHCYNSTWHLVKCHGENYSFDHHPWSRQPFFKFYFFFLVDDFLQFNERERERGKGERERDKAGFIIFQHIFCLASFVRLGQLFLFFSF